MSFFYPVLVAVGLMLGILACLELGRAAGSARRARDPKGASAGTGAIDGAVFALLGLLVAFSFSGAAVRFDGRRALVVQEANAIGTAYLRIDVLPAEVQPRLREAMRGYLDARLDIYRAVREDGATSPAVDAALEKANAVQGEIWRIAVAACAVDPRPSTGPLVLPAFNAMFDVATTRTSASRTHPPAVIFFVLLGLSLVASLLAGDGLSVAGSRRWMHMIAFAAVMGLTVYVIMDLEFPRLGFFRVDDFDQFLREVRSSMGGGAA